MHKRIFSPYIPFFIQFLHNYLLLSLPPQILKKIDFLPHQNAQCVFESFFEDVIKHSTMFYTDDSQQLMIIFILRRRLCSTAEPSDDVQNLLLIISIYTVEAWAIYNALLTALNLDLKKISRIISDSKSVKPSMSIVTRQIII